MTAAYLQDGGSPQPSRANCRRRWCCPPAAEPLEKRIRVDGVKTGRVTALDLPGQIAQAAALGIISESEAALLRDYDAKVLDIINVDDFAAA